MKRLVLILIPFLIIGVLYTYAGELKKLSLEQVILSKGEKLLKPLPFISGWADDKNYFQLIKGKLFKVDAKSGTSQPVLDPKANKELVKKHFSLLLPADKTPGFNKFLFVKGKTIFLFLRGENKLLPLIETGGTPKNPTFSPDGKKIAYTLAGNLFVFDIPGKKETQLTRDGSSDILNGYASWVYYEEILGRRSRYKAFRWSPDSTQIAFMRFDQGKVPVFTMYRAEGTYGSLEKMRYPKPGFPNPAVTIGIANIKGNQIQWIPCKDEKDHYLAFPAWDKKSNKIYFQWMNRDQEHLKILSYELGSQKIQQVYEEKQKSWVEFFDTGDFYLLKNEDILIRSSKDGWFHIYYISRQGKERQLTSGEWSVTGIECVNEKKKRIYFSAGKEASTETDFYTTGYNGKKIKKLTDFKGTHSVTVSPSGRYFIDSYSSLNTPTRIELRDNRGKLVRKIADSYSPVIKKYLVSTAKIELFKIKTGDGFELPAAWYLPPGFDKNKKYPVVLAVYGGPGSSIVRNSYGGGYRRGLQKFFLAQEGIINLFVDNRGSAHFGKKGMASMHRRFGKWEMYDYIQVVKYLRTLSFIDSKKIGIIGHSYGGYVAALALTYGADYFQYGISGSPVIDWALYDSVYTERYMDTPQDNPEGYKNSSTLTYADKYKGMLRITHGLMDDNVHAQNTIQFVDKILSTGKTLELMLYPGDRHGIRGKKRFEYYKSDINFWLKNFFGRKIK